MRNTATTQLLNGSRFKPGDLKLWELILVSNNTVKHRIHSRHIKLLTHKLRSFVTINFTFQDCLSHRFNIREQPLVWIYEICSWPRQGYWNRTRRRTICNRKMKRFIVTCRNYY